MQSFFVENFLYLGKAIWHFLPFYLLGSIPSGLLLTKIAGYGDIRKYGSGNIGATNVTRKSKVLGFLTLVCDVGKGALAVYLCKIFFDDYLLEILSGVAVVIGHVFPVWLKFKGGKGVAPAIGEFLVNNWIVGISVVSTWIIIFIISRVSAVAALAAFALAPVLTYFLTHDFRLILANSFICVLVIIRHKQNIQDIIKRFYTH
ncbi:MAG: glycerol-3-phosphate 1-O-acyltransferase PlsY [Rickettsiales bacterium]|nr:glycerol-3-phosphate 1-O-acyltransferase PlsY [Rickettsiales bacterium]